MILRELHGLLWEVHGPSRFKLHGRGIALWVELRRPRPWSLRRRWTIWRPGRWRVAVCSSREDAMIHVGVVLGVVEVSGDSAA